MRGVRFDWKPTAPGALQRHMAADIGFIAQEVEAVLPELVVDGHSGFKAVMYTGVIPALPRVS